MVKVQRNLFVQATIQIDSSFMNMVTNLPLTTIVVAP